MLKQVYIKRISAFMPNVPVSNDAMESVLGQAGKRPSRARKLILRSNKIKQRYYAIDPATGEYNYTTAELAANAIRKLEDHSFSCKDITLLCASTTIPDQLMPNHGVMVHGELGNPHCEVVSTAGVCISGMTALNYARLSIMSGQHQQAVSSAAETASRSMTGRNFTGEIQSRVEQLEKNPEIAFEKDFLRWMLSDGAGAMLLSDTPSDSAISLRIDWIDILSYANEQVPCMYAGAAKDESGKLNSWRSATPQTLAHEGYFNIKQDVKQLNENILPYTVEKPLSNIIQKRGLRASDYAWFVPHYSSGYFEEPLAHSLEKIDFNIAKDKWFTNLYTKGNTGSASIYIMLEELFNSAKLKPGEKILCFIPESSRFSAVFMQLTVI